MYIGSLLNLRTDWNIQILFWFELISCYVFVNDWIKLHSPSQSVEIVQKHLRLSLSSIMCSWISRWNSTHSHGRPKYLSSIFFPTGRQWCIREWTDRTLLTIRPRQNVWALSYFDLILCDVFPNEPMKMYQLSESIKLFEQFLRLSSSYVTRSCVKRSNYTRSETRSEYSKSIVVWVYHLSWVCRSRNATPRLSLNRQRYSDWMLVRIFHLLDVCPIKGTAPLLQFSSIKIFEQYSYPNWSCVMRSWMTRSNSTHAQNRSKYFKSIFVWDHLLPCVLESADETQLTVMVDRKIWAVIY